MRTQAPSQFQGGTVSTIDILLKVLLPALFAQGTFAFQHSIFSPRGSNSTECLLRQFKCKNGRCTQMVWMCDGEDDCGDNSDETAPECLLPQKCKDTEFKCKNGRCISQSFYCDGETDCADGSDEGPDVCGVKKCGSEEFECQPGFCIPKAWQCDGKDDCYDGKDEKKCNVTCSENHFTCANGKCIHQAYVCDLDDDCGDGSDEINCSDITCSSKDFQCADKSCVPKRWHCDGDFDCPDKSDEKHCPDNASPVCMPNSFACADRFTCIRQYMVCDGEADCPDGDDEFPNLCSNVTCPVDSFQCRNHQCIQKHLQCNGQPECLDGSDEVNCDGVLAVCTTNEFNCGDGLCIPMNKLCDSNMDCLNGLDEPKDKCGINECSIDNGGCSDICIDLPIGHQCRCRPGYELINNFTCQDINECSNDIGSCSQVCINLKGSFKCECIAGYSAELNDPRKCKANIGNASLFFTRRHDIQSISLNNSMRSIFVNNTEESAGLDFDYRKNILFWSDTSEKKIYKAPIDDGYKRVAVIDVMSCEGLAVDWIYNHIYWTDTGKKTIEVSDFGGSMRKTLLNSGLDEPRAIAVNPIDGSMFWTDWGNDGRIEKASMDGSQRKTLVSYEVKWPNGLTLDLVKGRVFWIDAKLNMISSVNFDGTRRQTVLKSPEVLHHPFSISVFEDFVYWTDWDSQTIYKANKFNGSELASVTDLRTLHNPMVVRVYHPLTQPNATNHCINTRCSHFCFPRLQVSPLLPRIVCACPNGFILSDDGITCKEVSPPSKQGGNDIPPEIVTKDIPIIINRDYDNDITTYSDSGSDKFLYIGIAIVVISVLLVIPVLCFISYRYYRNKNATHMTFECPFIKNPEQDLSLSKLHYQSVPIRVCPQKDETTEPLRSPGTNEYV